MDFRRHLPHLPREILSNVCRFVDDSLRMQLVCKAWQNATFSSPLLSKVITIDDTCDVREVQKLFSKLSESDRDPLVEIWVTDDFAKCHMNIEMAKFHRLRTHMICIDPDILSLISIRMNDKYLQKVSMNFVNNIDCPDSIDHIMSELVLPEKCTALRLVAIASSDEDGVVPTTVALKESACAKQVGIFELILEGVNLNRTITVAFPNVVTLRLDASSFHLDTVQMMPRVTVLALDLSSSKFHVGIMRDVLRLTTIRILALHPLPTFVYTGLCPYTYDTENSVSNIHTLLFDYDVKMVQQVLTNQLHSWFPTVKKIGATFRSTRRPMLKTPPRLPEWLQVAYVYLDAKFCWSWVGAPVLTRTNQRLLFQTGMVLEISGSKNPHLLSEDCLEDRAMVLNELEFMKESDWMCTDLTRLLRV